MSVARGKRRRRGFALLLVVGCLLVVTIAAVAASRQSLLLAIESEDAMDQLREHWGRLSIQRECLSVAAATYGSDPPSLGPANQSIIQPIAEDAVPGMQQASHWIEIQLHEKTYRVQIADESAKANVNTLLHLAGPEEARNAIVALSGGRLRGLSFHRGGPQFDHSTAAEHRNVESWGEVVRIGTNGPESLQIHQLPAITEKLTIVGDGKTNAYRASDEVLLEISQQVLPPSKSRAWVEEFRKSFPKKSIATILGELGVERRHRPALLSVFSLRSTCVSAWISDPESDAELTFAVAIRHGTNSWQGVTTRYTW